MQRKNNAMKGFERLGFTVESVSSYGPETDPEPFESSPTATEIEAISKRATGKTVAEPVHLKQGVTIIDSERFVSSSLATLKANVGKPLFRNVYDDLAAYLELIA